MHMTTIGGMVGTGGKSGVTAVPVMVGGTGVGGVMGGTGRIVLGAMGGMDRV